MQEANERRTREEEEADSFLRDLFAVLRSDSVTPIQFNHLLALIERVTAWQRGEEAFRPLPQDDDEAIAFEAVRPFVRQIAGAVRLFRATAAGRPPATEAADFPLDLGEAALWLPEFWSALADLTVRAAVDPTAEVKALKKSEDGWKMFLGDEPATFEALRKREAERRDEFRDELSRVFSVLRGFRRPGRSPRPAVGLLEEFEAIREREEGTANPRGAAKRAVERLARREGVTPSAIRKRLATARKGRKLI